MILLVERLAFGFLGTRDGHDSCVLPDLLDQIDKVEVIVRPFRRSALIYNVEMVDSSVNALDREFAEP